MENASVKVTGNLLINLKGIGLGDPLIDVRYQSTKYSEYAYNIGLINQKQRETVIASENQTIQALNNLNYSAAWDDFFDTYQVLINLSGGNSIYDVRVYNSTDNNGDTVVFMNLPSTKRLLNTPSFEYTEVNMTVGNNFGPDFAVGLSGIMPFLLDNIKVLIFNGQDDLLINTEGVENLLENVNWANMQKFLKSRKIVWKVKGEIAGYAMSYANMNLVMVLKAGHVVLKYQPSAVLDMVLRFIENKGWN